MQILVREGLRRRPPYCPRLPSGLCLFYDNFLSLRTGCLVCPLPLPQAPRASQAAVTCVQEVAQALPGHQNAWAALPVSCVTSCSSSHSPLPVSPETWTPDTRLPSAGKGGRRPGSEGLPSHLRSSGLVAAQSMREENRPVCHKRGGEVTGLSSASLEGRGRPSQGSGAGSAPLPDVRGRAPRLRQSRSAPGLPGPAVQVTRLGGTSCCPHKGRSGIQERQEEPKVTAQPPHSTDGETGPGGGGRPAWKSALSWVHRPLCRPPAVLPSASSPPPLRPHPPPPHGLTACWTPCWKRNLGGQVKASKSFVLGLSPLRRGEWTKASCLPAQSSGRSRVCKLGRNGGGVASKT